jgi:hypothetical protein
MEKCSYCCFDGYMGKQFSSTKSIDGARQNFEIYLFDSPEDEAVVLNINGTHTDVRIYINYCPMCGMMI